MSKSKKNKKEFPQIIAFSFPSEQVRQDIYLQSAYKRLCCDLSTIFGIIDKRLIEIVESKNSKYKGKFFTSYIESIIYTLYQRIGLFDLDKETFLKIMENRYDEYNIQVTQCIKKENSVDDLK